MNKISEETRIIEMDESPDSKQIDSEPQTQVTDEEILRRIIRVVVGIALVGHDALRDQLPKWEAEAAHILEARAARAAEGSEDPGDTTDISAPWFPKEWEYRLIGLAFESPNYIRGGVSQLFKAPQYIWNKTAFLRLPFDLFGVTGFTRNWIEGFVERIEADTEHLQKVGESEAEASRAVGEVALRESLDKFLQRLAQNEEVQELVQSQTTGLTAEVVDEIRERTVSTDNLIDAIVRRVLRQPPRLVEKMKLPPEEEKRLENF